jgi:PncC family amidohydrolase
MKTKLCCDVIRLLNGKTLVTAESLTGGGIGHALTSVSGSSAVYKGGIISYTNQVKNQILGVPEETLEQWGAVSRPVAHAMAEGVRKLLQADMAVSVTGLAGPGGDEYGNPVGTVFIGFADEQRTIVKQYLFSGDREQVRDQTIEAALVLILEQMQ